MRVIVGMSGGIDSSIAAYLLKQQGYEVSGAYFRMLESESGLENATKIATLLDIPLVEIDIRREFEDKIIKDFIEQYKMGFTPNPCVKCNEKIKFGMAFEKARKYFRNTIFASGHYASIEKNKNIYLKKASDKRKDQSYMLWRLKQHQLKETLFPLGKFTKEEVYEIAKRIKLPVPKSESQDVCFINGTLREFLKKYLPVKNGKIVTIKGEAIGKHMGAYFYTVGQRSGLGISYKEPLYVVKIDINKNKVIVGTRNECYFRYAEITDTNFIEKWNGENKRLSAKVRYQSKEASCILKETNGKIFVEFIEKQFAVAPGQSLVLYDGEYILGGGIIKSAY